MYLRSGCADYMWTLKPVQVRHDAGAPEAKGVGTRDGELDRMPAMPQPSVFEGWGI